MFHLHLPIIDFQKSVSSSTEMTFLAAYVTLFYGLIKWHNVVALSCISNEPVCGNDGNTYKTICHLSLARARNEDLLPLHEGHCQFTIDEVPTYSNLEESTNLGRSKKEKKYNSSKNKKLKDPREILPCHSNWFPVCGSDGNTYPNRCTALYETLIDPSLYVIHPGECKKNEKQSNKLFGKNKEPNKFKKSKKQNFKDMTEEKDVSKLNKKQNSKDTTEERQVNKLGKKQNLKDTTEEKAVSNGDKKQTLNDATEEIEVCSTNRSPVCGSDGTTYPNKCYALYATLTNPDLYVKHSGFIIWTTLAVSNGNFWPFECPFKQPKLSPQLCASDGNTYGTLCEFKAAQTYNPSLYVMHRGKCKHIRFTTTTNTPRKWNPFYPFETPNYECTHKCMTTTRKPKRKRPSTTKRRTRSTTTVHESSELEPYEAEYESIETTTKSPKLTTKRPKHQTQLPESLEIETSEPPQDGSAESFQQSDESVGNNDEDPTETVKTTKPVDEDEEGFILWTLLVVSNGNFWPFECPFKEQNHSPQLCSSDGITYGTLCEFKAAQIYNPTLFVVHRGKCKHIKFTTTTNTPRKWNPFYPFETTNSECKHKCMTTTRKPKIKRPSTTKRRTRSTTTVYESSESESYEAEYESIETTTKRPNTTTKTRPKHPTPLPESLEIETSEPPQYGSAESVQQLDESDSKNDENPTDTVKPTEHDDETEKGTLLLTLAVYCYGTFSVNCPPRQQFGEPEEICTTTGITYDNICQYKLAKMFNPSLLILYVGKCEIENYNDNESEEYDVEDEYEEARKKRRNRNKPNKKGGKGKNGKNGQRRGRDYQFKSARIATMKVT
ncbi:unnamed protein product [Diatraea saccharalis]|uniref:Kazal-like domain-containing protein n=1 Tax=Diatraea saccharalis TaxID=40085 RepID=A0A9N9W7S4_9NEOP|nr:unnamed protein product [Diatraea saccharalis]